MIEAKAQWVSRPSRDAYYMELARVAATRADCLRRRTGAILVQDDHIISTGYNGTPRHTRHCSEGGCPRCASPVPSGRALDTCLCVHAEVNAIVLAARYGTRTEGATMYATLQPCIDCTKVLIQAGVVRVYYDEFYYGLLQDLVGTDPVAGQYLNMLEDSGLTIIKLEVEK